MRKLFPLIVIAVFCLVTNAAADVFDLSPTNGTTFRGSDFGPGQGVIVGTTTEIAGIGFYLNMPGGGDLKYMIWDGTNSNLLLSSELTGVGASDAQAWVYSNPISFTLDAGNTYWFGIIADNNVDVGYIYPPFPYFANGLTAITSGNSNYSNFANPVNYGNGAAEIGLRLESAAVPEPGAVALLGTMLALIGLAYRKAAR